MDPEPESQLVPFIADAKAAGAADAFIVELLKASGWSERRIFAAFTEHYAKVLGRPVPIHGTRFEYARDGFLYLLAFISLGAWATAAGHLFYVLIDAWFPSTLDSPYAVRSIRDNVSLEVATIIVAFPIFAFVTIFINRELVNRPESADSGVRKWLTYIALVIAAIVLLSNGIFFLQSFLHGDLTVRFILDTIVLFAIVGAIFAYYLQTLRSDPVHRLRDRVFAAASGALVVFSLICGFSNIGWPQHQRLLSLDDQRVTDLGTIANRIRTDYRTNADTPATLPAGLNLRDPQTRLPYEYHRIDSSHYRLCANFAVPGAGEPPHFIFGHPQGGRTCFTLSADTPY